MPQLSFFPSLQSCGGQTPPPSMFLWDSWASLLLETSEHLCLWQAGPLSLSLCPYQCSTAGPGARLRSLNYRLRRTQCALLKAYAGHRARHFHGKGSELNPLLISSELPAKLTQYVRGKRACRAESRN